MIAETDRVFWGGKHRRRPSLEAQRATRREFERLFLSTHGITYAAARWNREHATYHRPEQRHANVKLTGGVRKRCKKGLWYWQADYYSNKMVGKKRVKEQRYASFSVNRLGDTNARLAATFMRFSWLLDVGAWDADAADPMAILEFKDSLKGNQDYADSVVVDEQCPFVTYRDR